MDPKKMVMTLDQCDSTFAAIREASATDKIVREFRHLLSTHPIMSFDIERRNTFWRGRKSTDGGFSNASELSYPLPEHCKIGRLNDAGKPCLYASLRRETVFAELDLREGDSVHVVGFRIKPEMTARFISFGELFHVHKLGYMRMFGLDPAKTLAKQLNSYAPEARKAIVYIDAFLGAVLSDTNAKSSNYLASRALAAQAYEKIPPAEGFFYPSVQEKLGTNVTIRPATYDAKFHLVCSQIIRITKVREFGFYDYEVRFEAKDLTDGGEFIWQRPASASAELFFGFTKREADSARKRGPE